MAGIKVADAEKSIPQDLDTKKMYEDYKNSKRSTIEDKAVFRADNLPFQPASIKQNIYTIGRIVGCPKPEFSANGGDAKFVLEHKLVTQNNKYKASIYFPTVRNSAGGYLEKPDTSWFMYKWLYFRLFKFEVNHSIPKGEEGRIVFDNSEHPLFKKYEENKAYDWEVGTSKPKPGHKSPMSYVLFNFIDRTDSWCADNKKTKVLLSNFNVSEPKDGKLAFVNMTPGVSVYGVYTHLLKLIDNGTVRQKDIAFTKNGMLYEVCSCTSDTLPANVQAMGKIGDLTAEEKNYEMVDLDPLFAPITYQYIMENWGKDIKALDEDLDTKDYEELEKLVEAEIGSKSKSVATQPVESKPANQPVEQKPAPFNDDVNFNAPVAVSTFDFSKFAHFNELPVEQQNLLREVIIGTDESGNPIFNADYTSRKKDLYNCFNDDCVYVPNGKRTAWPDEIKICPKCGEHLSA